MTEFKDLVPKTSRFLPAASQARTPQERQQRQLMVTALILLLVALGFVLYRDRDFWFPDTEQADDPPQAQPAGQTAVTTAPPKSQAMSASAARKSAYPAKSQAQNSKGAKPAAPSPASSQDAAAAASDSNAPGVIATRTVLPPLEVEVVAGDTHKTVHPGTNTVRVDLRPGTPAQRVAVPAASGGGATPASVASNAAEHVQMSADTVEVVSRPVRPDYPLLARQMKVQGSVILQALIGRDGLIQDLHVLSGPPILASAAQEAVKQWHFKPHYQGEDAVETQAKITVNFTISTN